VAPAHQQRISSSDRVELVIGSWRSFFSYDLINCISVHYGLHNSAIYIPISTPLIVNSVDIFVRKARKHVNPLNIQHLALIRHALTTDFSSLVSLETGFEKKDDSNSTSSAAWFENPTYIRGFAWWVEPTVAYMVGGWVFGIMSLYDGGFWWSAVSAGVASVVAAFVFRQLHWFRGEKVLRSDAVSLISFLTALGRVSQPKSFWKYYKTPKDFLKDAKKQVFPEAVYLPTRESGFYDGFEPLNSKDIEVIKALINLSFQSENFSDSKWGLS